MLSKAVNDMGLHLDLFLSCKLLKTSLRSESEGR